MSFFSRKSKQNQAQGVNAKANGQLTPGGLKKNADKNGTPDDAPVDPILQRMAIQAASRKRMNSQTPDYSIKSASSSPVIPFNDFDRVPSLMSDADGKDSQGSQNGSLSKTVSGTSALQSVEVIPQKTTREMNKLRKTNSNISPQNPQKPFPKGADPDTQKVRMPARESITPATQLSRDSGYASVVPSSTMISRTQSDLNDATEAEMQRKNRNINASMPRNGAEGRANTFNMPSPSTPNRDMKASTAPSTPTNRGAATGQYVSRLDPGFASSSFLTTSVVPQISKPQSSGTDRRSSGLPPLNTTNLPSNNTSPRRVEVPPKPTSNMSRPRESQPRPTKIESPQSRRAEPAKSPRASAPQARNSIAHKAKDLEREMSLNLASVNAVPTQTASAASTPYQTPQESRAQSYELPQTTTPGDASDAMQIGQAITSPQSPEQKIAASGSDNATTDGSAIRIPVPSPKPQDEFPYLAGIGGGATLPPISVLDGFKVNRRGQILDEEGEIIGELISGEIVHCVRRTVNANGEIVNDAGVIVGRAVAVPRRAADEDDAPAPNFANEMVQSPMSPMSPITPMIPSDMREIATTINRQQRLSERPKSMTERTLNNNDSAGNVVYIELDASEDSQAPPLMDHSEIFIPGTSHSGRTKSATDLVEIKRIAEGRRSMSMHTPTASQEKAMFDGKRASKKWTSQYYDGRTGQMSPNSKRNSIAKDGVTRSATEQRPRSFSAIQKEAPKAVLGPTWESLLDTVPDRTQSFIQHKSVILKSPERADTMPNLLSSAGQSSTGGSKLASGSMASRAKRTSQTNLVSRNSTHQPFAKSPLSSIANTPPDSASGEADENFQDQLVATSNVGRTAAARQSTMAQLLEEDDSAAPAPIVRKKAAASVKSGKSKSGVKRKSFFGIPFGKSKPVVAAN